MKRNTRYKHYLKENVASRRPHRLVFLDVDSLDERLPSGDIREHFECAWASAVMKRGGEYKPNSSLRVFSRVGLVWDYLLQQTSTRSRVLVCCPNPVRVLTLLQHVTEMQDRGWTLDSPTSSERFTAIAWRKERCTLLFVAHSNLFPMHRLSADNARANVPLMCGTWMDYLHLLDDIDAGNFCLSLGAQASSIYRHKYLNHPILVHGNKDVDELEQRATHGGIYQPYWYGLAPPDTYYYLDTVSMYPAMMAQHRYPWQLRAYSGYLPLTTLEKKLQKYACVASVFLVTEEPYYPLRLEGRTVYPVGTFNTTLTTPDLKVAFERNDVVECYAAAWYDTADLFSDFVRTFWELRRHFHETGRPMWEKWCKAIMVSLYGRWGAHKYVTRLEGDNPWDGDCAGQLGAVGSDEKRWFSTMAGKMWSSGREGLHSNSFPAIMAHVAAYGGRRMIALAEQAVWSNVYALISDGLIVSQTGYDQLQSEIQPSRLGMLKLKLTGKEFEVFGDVEFRLAMKEWRPGVSRDAVEVEDGVFVEYLFPSLSGIAHRGATQEYVRRKRTVRLNRQIQSGTVTPAGWIVPLEVWQKPLPRP